VTTKKPQPIKKPRRIPDGEVARDRYNVSLMTIWRWDHDPDLNFPKPYRIRGRKYRDEAELDAFDAAQKEASETR
jgi:hypothetical protein